MGDVVSSFEIAIYRATALLSALRDEECSTLNQSSLAKDWCVVASQKLERLYSAQNHPGGSQLDYAWLGWDKRLPENAIEEHSRLRQWVNQRPNDLRDLNELVTTLDIEVRLAIRRIRNLAPGSPRLAADHLGQCEQHIRIHLNNVILKAHHIPMDMLESLGLVTEPEFAPDQEIQLLRD